ncbi:MAG: lipid-binding protein [Tannerellaceae bacterium]
MKQIYKLLTVLLAVITFSSCETYGDYDTEYTAIYPLCGEWVVNVTNASGKELSAGITCSTYNTTDNATDKMWIKMGKAANQWGVRGKLNCNVGAASFEGNNVANLLDAADGVNSSSTFTVSGGKVIIGGFTTQAGTKADAVEFTMTSSKYPGETLTVKGFRKTGWEGEDY